MKIVKLVINSCFKIILFLVILPGTIFFSCNKKSKRTDNNYLPIDKIVVKDTIFVIDTICPEVPLHQINDSLMFLYIKQRNQRVIEKIKNNKGIIFNEDEINKFKNY